MKSWTCQLIKRMKAAPGESAKILSRETNKRMKKTGEKSECYPGPRAEWEGPLRA